MSPAEELHAAEPRFPPSVRIVATYSATDDSMPDTIEIIWETAFPAVAHVQEIVRMLAELPGRRYRVEHTEGAL